MKPFTTIDPVDQRHYEVVATVHDPLTGEGVDSDAVKVSVNNSRVRAIQCAQQWAKNGYWACVYNQLTGECIAEYEPEGGAQ